MAPRGGENGLFVLSPACSLPAKTKVRGHLARLAPLCSELASSLSNSSKNGERHRAETGPAYGDLLSGGIPPRVVAFPAPCPPVTAVELAVRHRVRPGKVI